MDSALGDGALHGVSRPSYGSMYYPIVEHRHVTYGMGGNTIFPAGHSLVPAGKWLHI